MFIKKWKKLIANDLGTKEQEKKNYQIILLNENYVLALVIKKKKKIKLKRF